MLTFKVCLCYEGLEISMYLFFKILGTCHMSSVPDKQYCTVIKALNVRSRPENVHVTLIDLQSKASYSGMVPGCISKLYTLDQGKMLYFLKCRPGSR